jgi:hypothetical protein
MAGQSGTTWQGRWESLPRGAPVAADAASRLWRELRSGVSKCPSEGSGIDFVHGMREPHSGASPPKARS